MVLLAMCLWACAARHIWFPPKPSDRVWYQQEASEAATNSDLRECTSIADDGHSVDLCMQQKGYLLLPRSEAELLRVKGLQEEGLCAEEIARQLHMSEKTVLRYLDQDYELPRNVSLGRQPVELSARVGRPGLQSLTASLKDHDPLARRNAAEALGRIEDPRAVEPLIAALDDPDPLIRRHIVTALGKIKDPRAEDPLISVLGNKEEAFYVRMTAAEALGEVKGPDSVEHLVSALNDPHWQVRSRAAKALGQIGDTRALGPLTSALKDEDPTVRAYAADALGNLHDHRAVEALVAALKDGNKNVRQRVERALRLITGTEDL